MDSMKANVPGNAEGGSMQREDKLDMTCSTGELIEVLRDMADALERGRISLEGLDLPWGEVLKISLAVKNRGGTAEVKMKVASGPSPSAPPKTAGPGAKPRTTDAAKPRGGYGALKKRMKKTFKNIMYALHEHAWPDAGDVDAFVRDSGLMVRYPGKGDEFYAAYSEAVAGFAAAVEAKDLEAATQKAHLLNDLKTRCHKLYD